jgi:hypothetical protein
LNHACAEFCIIAEPDRALERAEEETRRVIDLIRFSVPVIYPDESRVVIGLQAMCVDRGDMFPLIQETQRLFPAGDLLSDLYAILKFPTKISR